MNGNVMICNCKQVSWLDVENALAPLGELEQVKLMC